MRNTPYLPYHQALLLKSLGFYESTTDYVFINEGVVRQIGLFNYPKDLYPDAVYTPFFQEAFEWFRETHKLHSKIDIVDTEGNFYTYEIIAIQPGIYNIDMHKGGNYLSYREAELACIDRLIQLCQEKINEPGIAGTAFQIKLDVDCFKTEKWI